VGGRGWRHGGYQGTVGSHRETIHLLKNAEPMNITCLLGCVLAAHCVLDVHKFESESHRSCFDWLDVEKRSIASSQITYICYQLQILYDEVVRGCHRARDRLLAITAKVTGGRNLTSLRQKQFSCCTTNGSAADGSQVHTSMTV